MKNIAIYYSEFNIDSALASLILRESFDGDDSLSIKTICYNRSINFEPPSNYDSVYIVGPVFHSLHLETLLYKNPEVIINIYNINNDLSYKDNLLQKLSIITSPILEEDNSSEFKDLTTLVLSRLELDNPSTNILSSEDFQELVASILKYKQFKNMADVQELVYTHQCIELIKDCISNDLILDDIPRDNEAFYSDNKFSYNKHDQKIRSIINRNFSLRTFVLSSTILIAPVLNVSEEHAIAVMRLVSYSYNDIITYEDTATYRLYRVYSTKNNDWLIKCIKPHDFWYEGEILLLKTDIPSHELK